jgi:F0F1-type ATP synthase membrane subunit b/b'
MRSLHRKHAAEVIELKRQLSGVVQNKNSELEAARTTAEKLTDEMELFKAKADKKIEQMKEQTQQLVKEARHSLDENARKTLKKLAKERKFLKEKVRTLLAYKYEGVLVKLTLSVNCLLLPLYRTRN